MKNSRMIDRTLNYGRHHIRAFLARARPFRSIIDLGAGKGDDLNLAAQAEPQAIQLAIEVNPCYAEALREKGIKVSAIDIERDTLPVEDNSVDVVIANQVLEHTKDIFWILHEVSRALPVGGKFLVGVPNLAALHNRILLAIGRQPSPIKTASAHVRGFTKRDFLSFLEAAFPGGYQLLAFGGSNFYPFPPVIATRLASLFPNLAWGIFLMLEKRRDYKDQFMSLTTPMEPPMIG
ncbi:class I SAM-dependent methyltransferase [Desulfovermiculus halophilus]|uniref:class I SAM-dependent methyltransferase n=1 Tax=Desulfovermiculus halophilus TaxID=339722 RepID=UPI000684ED54|nr:class I SAM-dependent methyltransferase [Desulfovermiculus halophilus]